MKKRRIARLRKLFALFGTKSDRPWHADATFELAAERFIGSVQGLGSARHANLLALASDLVYESNYQLDWWQKLFFPILSWRLIDLQLQVIQTGLADSQLQVKLRRTVAKLEFGDKTPPAYFTQIVRQKILAHQFTNWQVRNAFNSMALKKTKSVLQIQQQPTLVRKLATISQWIFGVLSSLLFVVLVNDAFVVPTTHIPYAFYSLLTNGCILATGFSFQLGKQWTHGNAVMKVIWTADLVSL